MSSPNIITFKCPPGMNADDSVTVDKLTITLNQKVKKGQLLAILSSGNYEVEITAESDGIITELLIEEDQILHRNDIMWKIKTINIAN
ncbi:biotin/lipoyl-containing protein [Dokdonia sp.]|uniref:biotin/lipoyl-containing protein n=1 Tax=Dokdonia sp. TaxID=2024995 RepID=UPI003263E24A